MINETGSLVITWCVEDVLDLAIRVRHMQPTIEQAEEVLRLADKYHDACIGINWDVLSEHLYTVLGV